jgi:hypothetical protein
MSPNLVEFKNPGDEHPVNYLSMTTRLSMLHSKPGEWGMIAVYPNGVAASSFMKRAKKKSKLESGVYDFKMMRGVEGKIEVFGIFQEELA